MGESNVESDKIGWQCEKFMSALTLHMNPLLPFRAISLVHRRSFCERSSLLSPFSLISS
jgi:hypothetical protein